MVKALIVNSAATGDASVSRKLTGVFADRLKAVDPSADITLRDVGIDPLPHLTAETVGAIRGAATTEAERNALALSDTLIGEITSADIIVIGAPMYNFGIPSTLKAWFDHVLRAGVTFRYTPDGPQGLVKGKRALVIETRAGLYSEGPASVLDMQEPHLRNLLGFIGISDVEFVRAERLAFGPDAAAAAIDTATARLVERAETELALAA